MGTQFTLDFDIHARENNPISQAHLDENRHLFTKSCLLVLEALVRGEVLTTDNAKSIADTRSLPRRIKDLRDDFGLSISDDWVLIDGRKSHLKWWMSDKDKIEAFKVIMNKIKKAA